MLGDPLLPDSGERDGRLADERAHRMGFLHEISSVAISSLDAHDIADRIAGTLHARTGALITCVRLANRERSRLHIAASRGLAEGYLTECEVIAAEEDHLVPHVFATGEPVFGTDACASPLGSPLAQGLARWGTEPETLLVLPLRGATSTVGVLTLGWSEEFEFDVDDIDFYASIANILAVGVENAYLLEDAHEAADAAKRLSTASERLAGEFGGIFESLTDAVLVLDSAGVVVRANEPARAMLGLDPLGLEYMELAAQLSVRDRAGTALRRADSVAVRALRGETVRDTHYRLTANGSEINVLVSASPLVSGGVVSGAVLVVRDVTEREQLLAGIAQERRRVEDILTSITDGFAVLDAGGIYRYVNHALAGMVGRRVEDMIGRYVWDVFPEAIGTEFERAVDTVTRKGASLSFQQYYPPTDLWVEVRMYPSAGGASIFASDVSERRKAEEERERLLEAFETEIARTSLLKDTSTAAGTSLSAEQICERVLDTVRERLAPLSGMLYLVDPTSDSLVLSAHFGHTDEDVGAMRRVSLAADRPAARLLREGLDLVTHEAATPAVASSQPGAHTDARWLVLPVLLGGRFLGTLELVFEGRRPFAEDEISLFRTIAAQLSMALDNARLYQREHRIADTLQQSLLSDPARIDALSIGRVYRSATENVRVGGDFYDVYGVSDDRIAVAIGDVSGKGLVAARVTALVRNVMRAHALDGREPHEVLEKTNDALWHFSDSETFASAAYGVLAAESGHFTYCNGGHPAPLLLRRDGGVEELGVSGPVLGAFRSVSYATRTVRIDPGDILLLYTDGVIEARNDGGFFGEERLVALVSGLAGRTAEDIAQAVADAAWEHGGGVLRDDVAVLAIGSPQLPDQD